MITGINHVTLAVSELTPSIAFYRDLLGCKPVRESARSAYLTAGELWLCLVADPAAATVERRDYTHIAFSVAPGGFVAAKRRLLDAGVTVWRENRSEGDSLYFLDPDGHKLEIHVGTLESRLASLGGSGDNPDT